MRVKTKRKSNVANQPIDWHVLVQGQILYHRTLLDSRGEPSKVTITSIKRWKRSPDRFEIRWKYGLYDYGTITTEYELSQWGLWTIPVMENPLIVEE